MTRATKDAHDYEITENGTGWKFTARLFKWHEDHGTMRRGKLRARVFGDERSEVERVARLWCDRLDAGHEPNHKTVIARGV